MSWSTVTLQKTAYLAICFQPSAKTDLLLDFPCFEEGKKNNNNKKINPKKQAGCEVASERHILLLDMLMLNRI